MRFTLTLDLGNDAMRSGDDIRLALRRTGELLEGLGERELLELVGSRLPGIRDENGNTCGRWELELDDADRARVDRVAAGPYAEELALCGNCGWRGTRAQLRAGEEYRDEWPASYAGRREDIGPDGREFCPACDDSATVWTADEFASAAAWAQAVEEETGRSGDSLTADAYGAQL